MYRIKDLILGFSLLMIACQTDHNIISYDYRQNTPEWLMVKIDSISALPEYFGTKIYRYEWRRNYIYHIEIPISSCAYCELYDQSGKKINLSNDKLFQDFLENKRNAVLIWEWKQNSSA